MPGPESEALTRDRRVDPRLRAAGSTIVPFRDGLDVSTLTAHAVEEYPTDNGPADYALVVGGQLLGVVEAKKLTVGAGGVLPQRREVRGDAKRAGVVGTECWIAVVAGVRRERRRGRARGSPPGPSSTP